MDSVLAALAVLAGALFLMFQSRIVDASEASRRSLFGGSEDSRLARLWARVMLTIIPLALMTAGLATIFGRRE